MNAFSYLSQFLLCSSKPATVVGILS